jgi:hypothetical protein
LQAPWGDPIAATFGNAPIVCDYDEDHISSLLAGMN